jgi:hypothetical protein
MKPRQNVRGVTCPQTFLGRIRAAVELRRLASMELIVLSFVGSVVLLLGNGLMIVGDRLRAMLQHRV